MEEKTLFQATVCFLRKDGKVLLGMKMAKIGAGCWNGYGGGVEAGESLEQAAIRELAEETGRTKASPHLGITVREEDLQKVAVAYIHNTKTDGTTFECAVHFYVASCFEGEAITTEEMDTPTWFDETHLPLKAMMFADRDFVPLIMQGKKMKVWAWYGPFQKELLKKTEIQIVENLT